MVVAFVGLSPQLEGEEMNIKIDGFNGGDRTSLDLPAPQEKLLEAVAATGKPVIVGTAKRQRGGIELGQGARLGDSRSVVSGRGRRHGDCPARWPG